MQELARQLEAAQQVRENMHLVEHIKKCVAWGVVAIDRATIAKLDNQLEFELPAMAQDVRTALLCNLQSSPKCACRCEPAVHCTSLACTPACHAPQVAPQSCVACRLATGWTRP